MTGRVGRPRTDRLDVLDRAALLVDEYPEASANEIHALLGGRRQEALRVIGVLEWLQGSGPRPRPLLPGSQLRGEGVE